MNDNGLLLHELIDMQGVRAFAETAGMSDVYVYKLKSHERRASPEVYARVYNAFGSRFALVRQLERDRWAGRWGDHVPQDIRDKVSNDIVLVVTIARSMENGAEDE